MSGGIALLDLGLPMITSSTSLRSVRTFASASSSGASPFIGTSELVVVIRRPGTRAICGHRPEDLRVDADRHDVEPVGRDVHLGDDVALARLRHGDESRDPARDLHLHVEEPVPPPERESSVRARGVREVEVAVDGDRVVQRAEHRPAVFVHHREQPAAEALVVVHDVEVGTTVPQEPAGAEAERVRLREPGAAHDPELAEVDRRLDLPGPRRPERVRRRVQVEPGDLHELVGVHEFGVGLAREDGDVVAQVGQLAGEVPGVDALATAVRVPPVDEPGDAKRGVVGRHGRRHKAGSLADAP